MSDIRDFSGKNRKFTGTTGIKLPTGTTGQRVDETAQLRFNSTTNLAEYYDGTNWKPIDSPPVITSFTLDGGSSVTSATIDNEASGNATIVITGTSFDTTAGVVTFIPETTGSTINVVSTTRTNANTFTVTVARNSFDEGDGPYTMKLANGSGLSATLSSAITADNTAPSFATAADTNLGTVQNGDTATQYDANLTTCAATDVDGQTVTHSISAGSLPNGMSIESDGTFTGTASSLPTSAGVKTFTVSATDGSLTTTRQFKMTEVASAYMAATGGTTLTSGDYKTHVFNSPGNFNVSATGPLSNTVEYLVVAAGGGGSGSHGGGGGAGGMRENYPSPATGGLSVSGPTTYPITIGGGGAGKGTGPGASTSIIGGQGGQSVFSTITSTGGGGGAYSESGNRAGDKAGPGGSGGGGGNGGNGGGSGNTPSVSPPQGNNGGGGYGGPVFPGGGGGGKGTAGQTPSNASSPGGAAGVGEGIATTFFGPTAPSYGTPGPSGSSRYFAGGGGGGVHSTNNFANGGYGGGGQGGTNQGGANPGDAGTANTGGGAGGSNGQNQTAGSGGSGFVAIRYKFQ